jgi:hypothetical protein
MCGYMKYLLLLLFMITHYGFFAQMNDYNVSLAPFSTLTSDEFSPVFYRDGLVFCSNLKNNSLITYESRRNKLFNMFFISKQDSNKWKNLKILAKELTTNYNDGPASFNEKGDMIYYCRNNEISAHDKNVSDSSNKLGIYCAKFTDGLWTNIKAFTYNNPLYSFVTPALTYDAKRLYFASDMPGGYGGFDLYYCDWIDNDWDKPINLGPCINTSGNESYPFACKSGKLFFSSDGLKGFGGKDLYYSQEMEGRWSNPVHLDKEINSAFDDFGLVTDSTFEEGFFSSNRRKSDDVFSFTTNPVNFPDCDTMVRDNYCFLFYDEFQIGNDSIPVKYIWDFGSGIKIEGKEVKHCFPGPGKYHVKLDVMDIAKNTLKSSTPYEFELNETKQVYINSPDAAIIGNPVPFDGLESNLPDFNISDYLWDFGDGFKTQGPSIKKVFNQKGVYTVRLGLLGQLDSLGNHSKACACKTIRIFDDYQELARNTAKEIWEFDGFYSIESPKKDGQESLENISDKHVRSSEEQSNSLQARIYLLDNLAEMQKENIYKKLHKRKGTTIEINDIGIDIQSQPFLFDLVNLIKEDPDIKLEIAVHDNLEGDGGDKLKTTEKWASYFCSFFQQYGISSETIQCKAYGNLRPIVKEVNEQKNCRLRVEFIFMNHSN